MKDTYFNYWGKAKKDEDTSVVSSWHPLIYHSLDVVAVGAEYLTLNTHLSAWFCDVLKCSKAHWIKWASFWLALHDLGKFSEAFQSQKPDLFFQLNKRKPNPERTYTERHDSLGQWLWRDWLSELAIKENWFGNETELAMTGLDSWMRAVTGHHGQPPKIEKVSGASSDFYSRMDKNSVAQFVEFIRNFFLSDDVKAIPRISSSEEFEHVSQELSWWFSGIAVLADWLGSNTSYFPYRNDEIDLTDYWAYARMKAKKALCESGVLPQSIKSDLKFENLFPKIEDPSPLQKWANNIEISTGPQIYLLEDVTGAGKTEAAITLAYRLMAAGKAQGFFVALPTMATANAMYDRIANVYQQLFEGNPNLALVHGSRELVEKFADTILPSSNPENDDNQSDETATARCTAWLADHNKRALLAQVGVGTIDQALLGVLHSKHQSLRLLGLFHKVLVIDEVHACDAYMKGVLEVLLEFHARAGGSVILLSATLPSKMKQSLLRAYARGCGQICPSITQTAYPLATSWQSAEPKTIREEPVAARLAVARVVHVDYFHEQNAVIAEIETSLAAGQCVCWIRNTVADCLDLYKILAGKPYFEKISLFHARFSLHDRLEKEDAILKQFGSKSYAEQRAGRLVIATQVIEQSLDVDFDLLVTDLAPIDRIIQRAGRLKRHVRDGEGNRILNSDATDQRAPPRLLVYGPVWSETPQSSWFKQPFPKSSAVYSDHAQLWLTAKALQKTGQFSMPDGARDMIENVFDECAEIPAGLQRSNLNAQGQHMANSSIAKNNTLTFATGYSRGDIMDWWSEAKTPSRLGEASINVVLARWQNGKLIPWVNRAHAWAYSSVRVAERLIAKADLSTDKSLLAEYERVLESFPSKGKWIILLPLEETTSGFWTARAWTTETKYRPAQLLNWRYDAVSGLQRIEDNADKLEETE